MNPINNEDKLAVNKYDISDMHIKFIVNICQVCDGHPCLYIRPAICFKLGEGHTVFSHQGCLDCGSYRLRPQESHRLDDTPP